jgi:hypothetical protein
MLKVEREMKLKANIEAANGGSPEHRNRRSTPAPSGTAGLPASRRPFRINFVPAALGPADGGADCPELVNFTGGPATICRRLANYGAQFSAGGADMYLLGRIMKPMVQCKTGGGCSHERRNRWTVPDPAGSKLTSQGCGGRPQNVG